MLMRLQTLAFSMQKPLGTGSKENPLREELTLCVFFFGGVLIPFLIFSF